MTESTPPTRRQRVRDATLRELVAVSRHILATEGSDALTIRAVARDMGMTPAGVYRYFGSHHELMCAVAVAILEDLVEHLSGVVAATRGADPGRRLVLASRALRQWAVEHPRDFQLSMIVPGEPDADDHEAIRQARSLVGVVFGQLFGDLAAERGLPEPSMELSTPEALTLGGRIGERLNLRLPDASSALFVRCWLRLYGIVCVESMGLARAIGDDTGVLFEAELADLAHMLGLPATVLEP